MYVQCKDKDLKQQTSKNKSMLFGESSKFCGSKTKESSSRAVKTILIEYKR